MIQIKLTDVISVVIYVYAHLLYDVSAYNHHYRGSLDVVRHHHHNHHHHHHHHRFRPSLLKSSSDNNDNDNQVEGNDIYLKTTIDTSQIWSSRRKISKVALSPFVGYALDRAIERQQKEEKEEEERKRKEQNGDMMMKKDGDSNNNDNDGDSNNQGLLLSAFIIAGTAVALRLGGRGAFVQLLGLDFIADSGIKEQIDTFIQYFQSLDAGLRYLYFFFAWLVVKTLCIDALTIGTCSAYQLL